MRGPIATDGIIAADAKPDGIAVNTLAQASAGPCYRRGTQILTNRGEVPIETLQIGDCVMTMSGVTRPIRWIGRRSYSAATAAGNLELLPVMIREGALNEGVPRRDLWVSPQHAMFLDGMLIEARALLNDVSIRQAKSVDEVSYLHLEFEQHELIYAEGALAESFVGDEERSGFDNAAEYLMMYPEHAAAPARYCVARAVEGEALRAVRKRLADSSAAQHPCSAGASSWRGQLDLVNRERIAGWAQDNTEPERRLMLRILDNGTSIGELLADTYRADLKVAGIGDGCYAFSLAVPGGLAPEIRHLIEVQRVDDGRALNGSPYILEASVNAVGLMRNALPAPWHGSLDTVTRHRIEGWAWDKAAPDGPVALVILNNGEVIARTLANRYRKDLQGAGMGDGRHAFSIIIPGGLSPLTRHVIQVLGEADGCEMQGSPAIIAPTSGFDAALEHAISTAVSALGPAERERALAFLAAQSERLLQDDADAAAGREERLIRRQLERRWGKAQRFSAPSAAAPPLRRALVIDDLVPATDRDARSTAIRSHMRALQELGYEVSFVAAEELAPQGNAFAELEAQGIKCCRTPYYASVEEVLRRQHDSFDLVYLHRVSNAAKYLALARRYCQHARILYAVSDLHHVRVARQASIEGRPELLAYSRRLRLAETTAARSANAVITHSSVEAAWLRQTVSDCNVHVVPWAVPVRPTTRPWSERRGIAFIGNFGHSPNLDAAQFLTADIMPRVWRENQSIECLLVGSRMPEAIKRLSARGILPMGHVPDISTIYERVRVVVAPLRYGAGVKGKVLECLAAGVPCVLSPIAAEGIALPDSLAQAICADAAQMAAQILRLHENEAESQAALQAGLGFIAAGYSEEVVVKHLLAAIETRPGEGTAEVAVAP
jgi:glycosyltransferase involved in cell wall biosynthesis